MSTFNVDINNTVANATVIHSYILENKTSQLMSSLCILSEDERNKVVSFKINGNTALCLAVTHKYKDIVIYLIKHCGADVNQKGVYFDEKRGVQCIVPPIWCAAVTGKIDIVELLLSYGANVNDFSDTESTPVRAASFMNDYNMVEFLVRNGADITKTNIFGGTCLMNAVSCDTLVLFLLSKGSKINQVDSVGSTALHYAAREGYVDTTRIFLKHGADGSIMNKKNWIPLKLAAFNGQISVVDIFAQHRYTTEIELMEAYDLLGCHFVDENVENTRKFWRKSLSLRAKISQEISETNHVKSFQYEISQTAFAHVTEMTSLEILEQTNDPNNLYMQALMIYSRVLGEYHEDTIYKIRHRGAVYADSKIYQRCVDLWKYAYFLLLGKKDYLENDTVYAATSLANIFCEMQIKFESEESVGKVQFKDILEVFSMITEHVKYCQLPLQVQPLNFNTIENYKFLLQSVLHITNVFRCLDTDIYQKNEFLKVLTDFITMNVVTHDGESLLHLAVNPKTSVVDDTYYSDFPALEVIKLLLSCGIDTHMKDKDGETALLYSIRYSNKDAE